MQQQIETERITNISDLEQIVSSARADVVYLRQALKTENKEASNHLLEQLDLKLHRMEAFEFQIERRTITVDNPTKYQGGENNDETE